MNSGNGSPNPSSGVSNVAQTNFQSQQHLAKRYTKTGIIGRGTFGTVYRGIDNEDSEKREVAIKVMDLESIEDDINNIMQEIIALRDCQSEHVPKYYHSFNIGPELWIVMEYMGGGSVHDYLDPKEQLGLESENLISIILREVTKGLAYLHSLKMIHRDIKAANILLSDNGNVKLADFGVVGRLTETIEKRMTMIGSPYWMAPEVIVPEKGKDDGYGTPADIWSLGILGIEMANGIPPHGDQHPFEAMRRIMEGPPPTLDDNPEWSDNFRLFLSKCLEKDPQKRLTANELLKLDFFKDCGDISDLKEELIDAMKEFDTYDGDIEYYDENDQKYGSVIYSDTGTSVTMQDNQGTLNIINDGETIINSLTNDEISNQSPRQSFSPQTENTQQISQIQQSQQQSKQEQTSNAQNTQNTQNGLNNPSINLSNTNSNDTSNSNNINNNNNKANKLKTNQYSQSSRHVMRLSGSPVGAAIGGPRHSRQFSKRKSTAAAIRAHRKLSKQKSFNMSIEWTYSTRASLNMLQVPIRPEDMSSPVDLYDDTPTSQSSGNTTNNNNNNKKIKSKSIGNTPATQVTKAMISEDVVSDSENNNNNNDFDGGTMVRSMGARTISLENSKSGSNRPDTLRQVSVATYDIGIQTDTKTSYEKSVQTETHTVAHLVGIRKDIISICENMESELTDKGKEYLTQLKTKIREMTHLKITERRMKSINSEDAQEAQRRKNEIRAQSQILNDSDIQSTQARLKDLRAKMDARTSSKHKV